MVCKGKVGKNFIGYVIGFEKVGVFVSGLVNYVLLWFMIMGCCLKIK